MDQSRVRLRYDHKRLIVHSSRQITRSQSGVVLAVPPVQGRQAAKGIESAAEGSYEGRGVLSDPGNHMNSASRPDAGRA